MTLTNIWMYSLDRRYSTRIMVFMVEYDVEYLIKLVGCLWDNLSLLGTTFKFLCKVLFVYCSLTMATPCYAEVVNEDSTNMIGTTESVSETSLMVCSIYEAMNAGRRNTMEDVHVVCAPGTWGAPDKDMAYLAVYDGHGGKHEFLHDRFSFDSSGWNKFSHLGDLLTISYSCL